MGRKPCQGRKRIRSHGSWPPAEDEGDSIVETEDFEGKGEAFDMDFLMFTGMFQAGMDMLMLTDGGMYIMMISFV
jgi:hypothetical protein